jgi:protein-S-isoprenylcysteine O-methyltransferase Ste14
MILANARFIIKRSVPSGLPSIFDALGTRWDSDLCIETQRPTGRHAHCDRHHRAKWPDPRPINCSRIAPLAAGYALALWAMRVNRFFSSVIRIQTDRGQYVVATGPYAFVRHPGYTAGILIIAASGPALGSWLAAALLVIFSLPFLLHRAITEDRILQIELAGYSDYATRVRWRLVPGIW